MIPYKLASAQALGKRCFMASCNHVIQKWERMDELIELPTEPENTLLNWSMCGINCLS